ncbi:MAG TPA: peptidase MA family metallohydrolase [Anaerolineales bacterium]|nr:peptidase MA family metallohydrolase [Anaerolineales bacterium]
MNTDTARRRLGGLGVGLVCCLLALAASGSLPVRGQSGPEIRSTPPPEYVFGEPLTFSIEAQGNQAIVKAELYVKTADNARTFIGLAQFVSATEIRGTYQLDPTQRSLSAFTPVTYWWEVTDAAGATARSDPATFTYADTRFEWKTLESADGRLAVHWYADDSSLGQTALDAALSGYASGRGLLPGAELNRAEVYVYSTLADARLALDSASPLWVGGYANPIANAAVVIADPSTPDAASSLARDIPHELMHLLAAAAVAGQPQNVPTWYSEGLAQLNEPTPDPDDSAVLAAARAEGRLHALEDYCGPFPADVAEARLAYAHSAAVVRHIRNQYGATRLAELLAAYAGGRSCEAGVSDALGLTLSGLDQAWQGSPAVTPAVALTDSAAGWVVLALIVGFISPLTLLVTLGTLPVGRSLTSR